MTMNQWRWALLNGVLLSHMAEPFTANDYIYETIGLMGLSGILIYELIWIPAKSWWAK